MTLIEIILSIGLIALAVTQYLHWKMHKEEFRSLHGINSKQIKELISNKKALIELDKCAKTHKKALTNLGQNCDHA